MHPNVHVRSEAGGLLNLQGGRIAMLPHLSCTVSTIKVLSGTKPSLLCSNRQQTVEARFFASTCTTVVAFCLRTNGSEQQNRFQRRAQTNRYARTVKSSGRVRRDLKKLLPRTGQTREVTSSNGFCH